MMKIFAILGLLPLLGMPVFAQATTDGGWIDIVATYGIASPFVLLCLYVMREQRAEIKELREDNKRLSETALDKVLPTTIEAVTTLKDTAETLNQANTMMNDLRTKAGPDAVVQARLMKALEDVERLFQGTPRG